MKIFKDGSRFRYENMGRGTQIWIDDSLHRGNTWKDFFITNLLNLFILGIVVMLFVILPISVYLDITEPEAERQREEAAYHARICSGEESANVDRDWFLDNCNATIEAK